MTEILIYIIYMLAASIVGSHIAYEAEIVQDIKRWLCIYREHSLLTKLGNYDNYSMDMLWAYYVMLPFIFLIKKLIYLVNCPYCCTYWISVIIGYTLCNMGTVSFLLGFIGIAWVHLYRKISL